MRNVEETGPRASLILLDELVLSSPPTAGANHRWFIAFSGARGSVFRRKKNTACSLCSSLLMMAVLTTATLVLKGASDEMMSCPWNMKPLFSRGHLTETASLTFTSARQFSWLRCHVRFHLQGLGFRSAFLDRASSAFRWYFLCFPGLASLLPLSNWMLYFARPTKWQVG